ncbi:DsrE family protein [Persicitalea sp.]|uniref:DsrE family protein n=1 Tax=Persicitalea sp. TaxID=3100273 RepID=UPI0035947D9B
MKVIYSLALAVLTVAYATTLTLAQTKEFPVIKNGGGVFPVPEATPVADKKMAYKIVGDLTVGPEKPDELNPGLERVARLFNAYAEAGIKPENIAMVVVVHFKGTPLIMNDAAYEKAFGVANPNTALIDELAGKGVKFFVCGQSLRMRGYTDTPRNANINVTEAALIATTTYQMKGYAMLGLGN